jgi:hypothetical protein
MEQDNEMEDFEGGNYRFCINCWRTYVEFLPDTYDWQYTRRCKLCERKYQQDFMEQYPNTKRRHKLKPLSIDERLYYEKMMIEERGYRGDNDA